MSVPFWLNRGSNSAQFSLGSNEIPIKSKELLVLSYSIFCTVIGSQSGSLHSKWISQYLRHFSTEMAEIWSPGTFFEDVWTHKISALYHFRLMKLLVEITKYLHFKFDNSESKSDRELKFCVSKHLEKMCLETKFQPFRFRNDKDIECPT